MSLTPLQSIAAKLDTIGVKVEGVRAELKAWMEHHEARVAQLTEEMRSRGMVPLATRDPNPAPLEPKKHWRPRRTSFQDREAHRQSEAALRANSKEMVAAAKAKNEKAEARRAAYVQSVQDADRQSRKALACVNPRSGIGRAQHAEPDKDGRCCFCDSVIGPALPVGARAARQEARA